MHTNAPVQGGAPRARSRVKGQESRESEGRRVHKGPRVVSYREPMLWLCQDRKSNKIGQEVCLQSCGKMNLRSSVQHAARQSHTEAPPAHPRGTTHPPAVGGGGLCCRDEVRTVEVIFGRGGGAGFEPLAKRSKARCHPPFAPHPPLERSKPSPPHSPSHKARASEPPAHPDVFLLDQLPHALLQVAVQRDAPLGAALVV